jgi:hypothetical protein
MVTQDNFSSNLVDNLTLTRPVDSRLSHDTAGQNGRISFVLQYWFDAAAFVQQLG